MAVKCVSRCLEKTLVPALETETDALVHIETVIAIAKVVVNVEVEMTVVEAIIKIFVISPASAVNQKAGINILYDSLNRPFFFEKKAFFCTFVGWI